VRERESVLRREIDEARGKREELNAVDVRLSVAEDAASGDADEARNVWSEVAGIEADVNDDLIEVERLGQEVLDVCGEFGRLAQELETIADECEAHVETAETAATTAGEHQVAASHAATEAHNHAAEASHLHSQVSDDPKYDEPTE